MALLEQGHHYLEDTTDYQYPPSDFHGHRVLESGDWKRAPSPRRGSKGLSKGPTDHFISPFSPGRTTSSERKSFCGSW